jgi:hypothetical protein
MEALGSGRRSGNADWHPDDNLGEAIKHICKTYGVPPEVVAKAIASPGDFRKLLPDFSSLKLGSFTSDIDRARQIRRR